MSITWWESFKSRSAKAGRTEDEIDLIHYVEGTDDESTAIATIVSNVSAIYGTLIRDTMTADYVGVLLWELKTHYKSAHALERPKLTPGSIKWDFDTTGATTKITQSLATRGSYGRGGATAPDNRGAIGVSGTGTNLKVEGTDIPIGALKFRAIAIFDAVGITLPYHAKFLASVTGTTNDAPWKQFSRGEVRFLGARIFEESWDPNGAVLTYRVEYEFEASSNLSNIAYGSGSNQITVTSKRGWDYLWFLYRTEEDATAKSLVQVPLAAYVEQVSYESDYANLGLGV